MLSLFSFEGKIGRRPYALWSLGVFGSQYLVLLAASRFAVPSMPYDPQGLRWLFFLVPLRTVAEIANRTSQITLLLCLVYLLIVAWVLAALAFRRAADANFSEWVAAWAVTPVVQIPTILLLCAIPPYPAADDSAGADNVQAHDPNVRERDPASATAAAQGVAAGLGLTLAAVVIGALVFGAYGYGVFVFTPFVVGATTAYLANRTRDLGLGRTLSLVMVATLFGGLALVALAIEGIICLAMAAPIWLGFAAMGGLLGRSIALVTRRPAHETLSCVALLPLVFAGEYLLPPMATFDSHQTVVVDASPEAVWRSLLSSDPIEGPLALPFQLGVAHPLRSEIIGEDVGAIRRGEFSTGTAIERITEWVPNRKLAFVVETDVPSMRELSPYEHVHAVHAIGYFRTAYTSFDLVPRFDGGTDIVERTSHELRLDPVLYWLPIARWVVHENNARVLAHIRHHAERSVRAAAE
jgi:uncharacterized membrane protein YhaH (DUF805 family)